MAELIEIERQRLIHMVMALDSYEHLMDIYEQILRVLTKECQQQLRRDRTTTRSTHVGGDCRCKSH